MPRQRKLRAELENTGVLLNSRGIEIGRMTLTDNLILDPLAFYTEIERAAATNYGRVKITWLYRKFGRYGTHGSDPAVLSLIGDMFKSGYLEVSMAENYVRPLATLQTVAKFYPPYVTRAQVMAGLEPIDNE